MAWPDIPKAQIISYQQLKDGINDGYLKANNKLPGTINLSEMVSVSNFQYYCNSPLTVELASNQLVPRGAVEGDTPIGIGGLP